MTSPQPPTDLDPRVNAAVQEYLERIDRGESVDHDQFLAKHAEVGDALRSFIVASEELAKFARKSDVSAISTNSVAADVSRVEKTATSQAAGAGSRFDTLPTDFGRYRVQRLLGRGAMGAVFLADDRQLERQVALKIPSFDQGQGGDLLARFYREARSAAMLRQPNICPVYDVGEIDGQHYITMAFIAGRPLSDLIKSDKPPGERQILLIVRKLALALQEAHTQGIIHRDLKPGNVMIDARGEPIVMDFGLACRVEQKDAARLTHSGVIVGSPAYMSPEQVEGNPDKMTAAADQYSLGVMLYEMLTGQLPFRGSIAMVIAQIATKSPQPLRELKPEIDPRIETVCLRMLSKSANDRFPSLKAVADEVATILREPKPSAAPPTTSTVTPTTSATQSMADRQRQIQTLLKDGNVTAAQEALNGLAALNDPRMAKVADWARQQMSKLRADAQRWATEAPEVLELARKLVKKHDYADAAKLLTQVPLTFRSADITDLLEQATDKQEECEALLADIDKAIRKEQPKELPVLVKRLLQLKPGHTGIQRLAADMKKHGVERAMRTRKGDKQYLDPAGQVWNPLHLAYAAGGLAALCLGLYLTVIAFQTKFGTVVVEVRDPSLSVTFHNDVITLESSGKKYQLKPTEQQQIEVEHDGLVFVSPTVTVKRGDTTQAVVSLQGGKPTLTINGQPQELTTTRVKGAGPQPEEKTSSSTTVIAVDDVVPADAVVYNGHAYKLYPEKLSWTAAKRRCEELGGHLPTIADSAENDFLTKLAEQAYPTDDAGQRPSVWIGASDAADEGDWRWVDGDAAKFTNWFAGQPNNKDGEEHYALAVIKSGTDVPVGQWCDQPDGVTSAHTCYLVCEWDRTRMMPQSSVVPADAVAFNGHFYKFFAEKLSWTEAKARCESLGGHLPVVETAAENAALVTTAAGKFAPSDKLGGATIWLGASDATKEGDWKWLDASSLAYKNWYGQQPNNGGQKANEHFATLLLTDMPDLDTKAGQWSDQPLSPTAQDVYFVCEWDGASSRIGSDWIDLLTPFDVAAHNGPNNSWSRKNGVVTAKMGPARKTGWVGFKSDSKITGDYDLEVELYAVGCSQASVSIPVNDTSARLSFDGSKAVLHWIDGKTGDELGPQYFNDKLKFEPNQRATITASVRHHGDDVALEFAINGTPAAKYSGKRSRLSIPDTVTPGIGQVQVTVQIPEQGPNDRLELSKIRLRPVRPTKTIAIGEWIDLLAPIDPKASSRPRMTWTREGATIIGRVGPSRADGWISLTSPIDFSGDYDLELDVLPMGCRDIEIELPLNETMVTLAVRESGTGLSRIDGKMSGDLTAPPEQGSRTLKLRQGVVQHVTASVRHQGDNVAVETQVDGVPAGTFSGKRSRVKALKEGIAVHNHLRLAIALYDKGANDRIEIPRARVRSVAPSPATVGFRDLVNRPDANGWIDLLSAFDASAGPNMTWSRQGSTVTGRLGPQRPEGWMIYESAPDFSGDLDVEVDFLSVGSGSIHLAVPLNETIITLGVSAEGSDLRYIDPRDPAKPESEPSTSSKAARLKPGTRQRFAAKVRHQGENVSVETWLDDQPAGSYAGLRSRVPIKDRTTAHVHGVKIGAPMYGHGKDDRIELHQVRLRRVESDDTGFIDLFNGRDLTGWNGDPQYWTAANGVLASSVTLPSRPAYLLTDREFSDFELRLQFKLQNDGNTGVQYRTQRGTGDDVIGHQAEIGFLRLDGPTFDNIVGDIFVPRQRANAPAERPSRDMAVRLIRTAFLSHAEGERRADINAAYKPRDWNDLTIRCRGPREIVELNGVVTADINQLDAPPAGRIGFQLWNAQNGSEPFALPADVQFRNIRIKELSPVTTQAATPAAPPRVPRKETWLIPTSEQEPQEWLSKIDDNLLARETYLGSTRGFFMRKGPFGHGEINGGKFGSKWDKPHIALRKTIEVPDLTGKSLVLRIAHDDSAWLYVNGRELDFTLLWGSVQLGGANSHYVDIPLTADQQKLFAVGANRITVWCENVGGPQFLDVGLKLLEY